MCYVTWGPSKEMQTQRSHKTCHFILGRKKRGIVQSKEAIQVAKGR